MCTQKTSSDLYDFEADIIKDILMKKKIGKISAILTPGALGSLIKSHKKNEVSNKSLLCAQIPFPWQLYFTAKIRSGGDVYFICADPDELPKEVIDELIKSGWERYDIGKDIEVVETKPKTMKEVKMKVKVCVVAPVIVEDVSPITGELGPTLRHIGFCKVADVDEVFLLTCDGENYINCFIAVHMEIKDKLKGKEK